MQLTQVHVLFECSAVVGLQSLASTCWVADRSGSPENREAGGRCEATAFTRVRKTKFKENILWVKNVIRDGIDGKPTQIALHDIVHQRRLQEIEIQPYGLNAILSILPAFEPR